MHFDNFGSSGSGSGSDDDDDDGGWLSQSTFELNPPVSSRRSNTPRRPLSSSGFEVSSILFAYFVRERYKYWYQDVFNPGDTTNRIVSDPFSSSVDDVSRLVYDRSSILLTNAWNTGRIRSIF
jgi:hypothetical protein